MSCVGITPEEMPEENEQYYCPNCKGNGLNKKRAGAANEFGGNIFEEDVWNLYFSLILIHLLFTNSRKY